MDENEVLGRVLRGLFATAKQGQLDTASVDEDDDRNEFMSKLRESEDEKKEVDGEQRPSKHNIKPSG